jgi:hypothetical protein
MDFFYRILLLWFFCLGLSIEMDSMAQTENEKNNLFESEDILNLNITMDFDSIFNNNFSESKKYPAILSFPGDRGEIKKYIINLSKRGHFRKSFNVCNFPPLRIHFNKDFINDSIFAGISKIKLVTHCQNYDTAFDQYILMEYYIYRMYNMLTQRSFRVRLAKITYTDKTNKYDPMLKWAFFIENPSDLAYRVNGKILDIRYISPENTDPYYFALMSLFQFMIISQDWSVSLLHNVELVGIYPSLRPVTIPFDFDMAGIINIPYDSHLLDYRKGKEPKRVFLAKKIDKKAFNRAISQLKKEKTNIYALINNSKYLNDTVKIYFIRHLNDFYYLLYDKSELRKSIKYSRK